jgi:hypothetical protein
VDNKLLANGCLARGLILDYSTTGTTLQSGNGFVERVCTFTLEIRLDDTAPYNATVRQRFPEIRLSEIDRGNTLVAVRVDPANPANVAIDWATPAPTVTIAANPGQATATALLETGDPCEVLIIESRPLGMKNSSGIDLHAFMLTVFVPHKVPYQTQVGNPVPPDALPLLFPGSRLPAKVDPAEPKAIAIDWIAALASFQ